jgi:hypothetical protein
VLDAFFEYKERIAIPNLRAVFTPGPEKQIADTRPSKGVQFRRRRYR